jgi:hypothetical protein
MMNAEGTDSKRAANWIYEAASTPPPDVRQRSVQSIEFNLFVRRATPATPESREMATVPQWQTR